MIKLKNQKQATDLLMPRGGGFLRRDPLESGRLAKAPGYGRPWKLFFVNSLVLVQVWKMLLDMAGPGKKSSEIHLY